MAWATSPLPGIWLGTPLWGCAAPVSNDLSGGVLRPAVPHGGIAMLEVLCQRKP